MSIWMRLGFFYNSKPMLAQFTQFAKLNSILFKLQMYWYVQIELFSEKSHKEV